MVHIIKSDRWLGYAALVCAAIVILVPWLIQRESLAVVFVVYCLGPFGLFLALRGVFVGRWPSRICAGVALIFFGWLLYSFIAALMSAKIRG
jgi:uncharacterized membrane protein